jgi:hypothetical protein
MVGDLYCREHLHFGEGKVAVQSGSVGGIPALIFTHAVIGGTPGELASAEEPSAENPDVLMKSVVFTFKSKSQRDAVEAAFGAP